MEFLLVLLCGGLVMGLMFIVCRAFGRSAAPHLMGETFRLQVGAPAKRPHNGR